LLEAESFLTVPVVQGGEIVGRLYLTARQNCFERSEIEFISQLMEQVWTAVDNVELLNHLASDAANRQRQKISRDLHDSTIQPYIGLKLGLEALELKCAAGESIEKDVEKVSQADRFDYRRTARLCQQFERRNR
jgi:GAF domain-containing protein